MIYEEALYMKNFKLRVECFRTQKQSYKINTLFFFSVRKIKL